MEIEANRLEPLSIREREVAEALHQGKTRRAIAASMGIAAATVNRHIDHIYMKLGINTVAQIVLAVERAKVVAK